MKMPQTKLGLFLRKRRLDLELTAARVAELLGVSPQTISDWELGRSKPNRLKHVRLEKILKLNPEELDFVFPPKASSKSDWRDLGLALAHQLQLQTIEDPSLMDLALASTDPDKITLKPTHEVLQEQDNLPKGATVIFASNYQPGKLETYTIANHIERNLAKGIAYILAFENADVFDSIMKLLSDTYTVQRRKSQNIVWPKICRLDRIKDLDNAFIELMNYELRHIVIIYDERGLEIEDSDSEPLRGYRWMEVHDFRKPMLENLDVCLPIHKLIFISFTSAIKLHAEEWNAP